jgi:four helix bundle protein
MRDARERVMDRPELERRSARFGIDIAALCDLLTAAQGPRRQIEQLLDSSTSVGANYRATSRSRSRKEFAAKMGLVAEEADEAVHWLEFFQARNCGDPKRIAALLSEARELRAIFAAAAATSRRPKPKNAPGARRPGPTQPMKRTEGDQ